MGDEVLCRVAEALRDASRDSDIVCRYGGEEFAILLTLTDSDAAVVVAERVRETLEKLVFPEFTITASVGVSTRSAETQSPQELLDQADKCLYVAKRGGRNQTIHWKDVPEDLVIDESSISRTREEEVDEPVTVPYHAVAALISALAYRDQGAAAHSRRVADLCIAVAEGLLSLKDCYTLEIAALLHDIGRIGLPDSILLKTGPLTPEEWAAIRRSNRIGIEILRTSFASPQLTEIIENYQARYGDSDTPSNSLSGDRLPVGSRILAIAEAYDAITTDQVFRKGRSAQEAFAELRRCAGTQFDPELVERFIATVGKQSSTERPTPLSVTKEAALVIGLQIERLSQVLDEQDFDSLDAMSRRLRLTADKCGAEFIGEKASELGTILDADRDPHSIMRVANELLDLCRSTQQQFLESQCASEQAADEATAWLPSTSALPIPAASETC
jgi:response regulator RpfG family c-di-GMP phosphodiesterase